MKKWMTGLLFIGAFVVAEWQLWHWTPAATLIFGMLCAMASLILINWLGIKAESDRNTENTARMVRIRVIEEKLLVVKEKWNSGEITRELLEEHNRLMAAYTNERLASAR